METTFIIDRFEAREAADGHRELECVVVPYGKMTRKAGIGRPERFAPHALASAVVAQRVRLRSHNHSLREHLAVGVADALEDLDDGLHARFRLYNTDEGRSAFENVQEGVYGGVSLGFAAVRERDVAGVREILEARLHHVSLVEDPAYDDAQILAVRVASEYEWMRHVPAVTFSDADDTPMSVRVRQILGNVRGRS